jgi:hypothetical protein
LGNLLLDASGNPRLDALGNPRLDALSIPCESCGERALQL